MANSNRWIETWAQRLEHCWKLLAAGSKRLRQPPEDPFVLRDDVRQLSDKLGAAGLVDLIPPESARQDLEDLCTQLCSEFWDRFAVACAEQGWKLHGSTSRRLLACGIFIELKGEQIHADSRSGRQTPYVPTLIDALRSDVEELLPASFRLDEYADLLAEAYARTPGETERPLEEIYRNAVMLIQKDAFWKAPNAAGLIRLTRPMFRVRLTELLRGGSGGGRPSVRLGTTVDVRRAWEIFSPGEGQVVQVGRLALS